MFYIFLKFVKNSYGKSVAVFLENDKYVMVLHPNGEYRLRIRPFAVLLLREKYQDLTSSAS